MARIACFSTSTVAMAVVAMPLTCVFGSPALKRRGAFSSLSTPRGQTWAQTSQPIPSLMPQKSNAAEGLAVWKFAVFAALAMTVPYLAVAYLLGPEFPSLLGGLIGLAIVVPANLSAALAP